MGNALASAAGNGQPGNGNQTINFDFDGNLIGRSGTNGPYIVQSAGVNCNFVNASANPLMTVQGFMANQFTNIAPDFTLSAPAFSILPGGNATVELTLSGVGSFSDIVNFMVTSVPSGFTSSLGSPVLAGPGFNFLTVTAPANATLGTSSIAITYATATVMKTLTIPVTVVSQYPVVTVNPANQIVVAGGTQQFSATVTNTSNQGVTWSLSSPIGTIDPVTGLYTAPSNVTTQQSVAVIAASLIDARITGSVPLYLTPLGAPWLDIDLGAIGSPGNASIINGVFTVQGAGNSIDDTNLSNDGFNFLYQPLAAVGSVTARVVSTTGEAALMMLGPLFVGAADASLSINQTGEVMFCNRVTSLGTSQCNTTSGINLPYWLRLTRNGGNLAGFISPDGVNWTQVGGNAVSMGSPAYLGLAGTSLSSGTLGTTIFDNVAGNLGDGRYSRIYTRRGDIHFASNRDHQQHDLRRLHPLHGRWEHAHRPGPFDSPRKYRGLIPDASPLLPSESKIVSLFC